MNVCVCECVERNCFNWTAVTTTLFLSVLSLRLPLEINLNVEKHKNPEHKSFIVCTAYS